MGKSKDVLMKGAIAICLVYVLIRLGEFIYGFVPPYHEGQCMAAKANPYVIVKVIKNHIWERYSDVHLTVLFLERDLKASFAELRGLESNEVECP